MSTEAFRKLREELFYQNVENVQQNIFQSTNQTILDGQAPPVTYDDLSDDQVKVLNILTICSASLSVVGSSTIVYKILQELAQDRSRFMTPYDRIILCLSTCDILASITYASYQFLIPSESGVVWAFGTSATCQASGFLTQLWAFWAIWYNCILSFYFLLTVLSKVRLQNLVPRYEPWLHFSGIFFPITAVTGYFRGWYDKDYPCYITDPAIQWIVAGIPFLLTYLLLTINYSVISLVLRKTLRPTSSQDRIKREATTLMFLYVGFFLVTTFPNFLLQILDVYFGYTSADYGRIYPLFLIRSATLPLQGFFNVFIYLKPAYTRFRVANPNKPMHFVLHQALFNPKVPRLSNASNAIEEGDEGNPNQALFNSSFPSDPPSDALEDSSGYR